MIELPLVFIAGVLGSSHCIGMCGPFALTIGSGAKTWKSNLARQIVFSLGRIFTYCVLGSIAGYGSWRFGKMVPTMVNVPALLAVVAGLFLIYQGTVAAGVIDSKAVKSKSGPCLAGTFFGSFLNSSDPRNTFLAGVFTGFLPCGLVYGFLALAASSSSMLTGATVMLLFGLGTTPVMVLTGVGGSLISYTSRQHLYRFAAWGVVLAGVVSVARGVGFVENPGWISQSGCPFCQ